MDGIGRFFCALVAIKELSLWSMDSINCATAPLKFFLRHLHCSSIEMLNKISWGQCTSMHKLPLLYSTDRYTPVIDSKNLYYNWIWHR